MHALQGEAHPSACVADRRVPLEPARFGGLARAVLLDPFREGFFLELIEVPAPGQDGARAERVAAVLNAQMRLQAWTGRRALAGRLVIAVSVAMAYTLFIGEAAPGAVRAVLAIWSVGMACLGVSTAAALEADRRVGTLLKSAGGRRIHTSDRNAAP
jgi:hypothetical protein